jgi:anti-sigma B factor antagonist
MPKNFDIDVATEAGELVARVSGEFDLSAREPVVARVTKLLGSDEVRRVAVDLGHVTFCDSSGLGALLDIRRAAGDAGVEMVLRNVPPPVARLLDLTDVDGWLQRE